MLRVERSCAGGGGVRLTYAISVRTKSSRATGWPDATSTASTISAMRMVFHTRTAFDSTLSAQARGDRFAQHYHAVDIDAESWRQKHAVTREPRDPAAPTRTRPKRRRA